MKKLFNIFFSIILPALIFVSPIWAQNKSQDSFIFSGTYTNDMMNNFYGGKGTGFTSSGLLDFSLSLNTENANLWPGGIIFFEAENTHGGTPSVSFIGDLQTASNVENGNYTYLYQLYYLHKIKNLSFISGLHDLNSEFLINEYSGDYINSSLGIMPSVSLNVPVSIFPKTTWGLISIYNPTSDRWQLKFGVYEGDPLDLDTEKNNLQFKMKPENGMLYISELKLNTDIFFNKPGSLKLGGYFHSGEFTNYKNFNKNEKNNYGIYFIANQLLSGSSKNTNNLESFLMGGWAPKDKNFNHIFLSAGINMNNFKILNKEAMLGLCAIYMEISPYYEKQLEKHESALETFLKINLFHNVFIQQDFQYIINCGANKNYNNSFLTITRFNIEF